MVPSFCAVVVNSGVRLGLVQEVRIIVSRVEA